MEDYWLTARFGNLGHNATWIETDKDIIINENLLKEGKYGFFTIPNKDRWTIIFNKNWNQHGKDDYKRK